MTEDLRRQRRNLLVVSGLLWFKKLAGLTVASVSVLGTSFNLDRPDAIAVALWLLWVYAVIRYAQYFWEDGWPRLTQAREAYSMERFPKELVPFVKAQSEQAQGSFSYKALHKTANAEASFPRNNLPYRQGRRDALRVGNTTPNVDEGPSANPWSVAPPYVGHGLHSAVARRRRYPYLLFRLALLRWFIGVPSQKNSRNGSG